jgi:hypothetical protein
MLFGIFEKDHDRRSLRGERRYEWKMFWYHQSVTFSIIYVNKFLELYIGLIKSKASSINYTYLALK